MSVPRRHRALRFTLPLLSVFPGTLAIATSDGSGSDGSGSDGSGSDSGDTAEADDEVEDVDVADAGCSSSKEREYEV